MQKCCYSQQGNVTRVLLRPETMQVVVVLVADLVGLGPQRQHLEHQRLQEVLVPQHPLAPLHLEDLGPLVEPRILGPLEHLQVTAAASACALQQNGCRQSLLWWRARRLWQSACRRLSTSIWRFRVSHCIACRLFGHLHPSC